MTQTSWIDGLRWNEDGLIPAIVQDHASGAVLMLAWMNREALERSIASGEAHFYSRSRKALWHKGGTSGHVQRIDEIRVDCDADVLLLRVVQTGGGACHEGYESCFFRKLEGERLQIDAERRFDPARVYPGDA